MRELSHREGYVTVAEIPVAGAAPVWVTISTDDDDRPRICLDLDRCATYDPTTAMQMADALILAADLVAMFTKK